MADMEIGIWGDSITYGESDSEALGWVGRFRKTLPLDEWITVYNRGICGDTTEDLLKRFAIEAEAIVPNIVVFAIGINDSKLTEDKTGNNIPLEDFKRNLQTLIEQAQKHAQTIYLIGLANVDESAVGSSSKFTNEQVGIYNDGIKKLAESNKLPFIDFIGVLDVKTDLYDGLHPNDQGYEKLSKVIINSIKV
ncbi:MAG: peptidase [Parcubacteria group bacterium]|nr:peptidase [Parcubacteria group bacterium]